MTCKSGSGKVFEDSHPVPVASGISAHGVAFGLGSAAFWPFPLMIRCWRQNEAFLIGTSGGHQSIRRERQL
jgi:hypothetical protein